jgi:hypothetical protein
MAQDRWLTLWQSEVLIYMPLALPPMTSMR